MNIDNDHKKSNHPVFNIYDQNFVIPEVEGEDKNSYRSLDDLQPYNTLTNVDLNNSQASDDKKSEKKFSINITASDIVNQMSHNAFNTIKESNQDPEKLSIKAIPQVKKKTIINSEPLVRKLNKEKTEIEQKLYKYNKRLSVIVNTTSEKDRSKVKGKTLLKSNHQDEIFKDFFNLTYQSFKLNSNNIEPFLHVSVII